MGSLPKGTISWTYIRTIQTVEPPHNLGVSLGGIPGCPYVPLCPNVACFDSYTVTDNITSSGENERRNECMSVLAHAMQDGGGPGLP